MATDRSILAGRPTWADALLVFAAFRTFVCTPWDVFVKPVAEDEEAWLGLLLTGRPAKATALVFAWPARADWRAWKAIGR